MNLMSGWINPELVAALRTGKRAAGDERNSTQDVEQNGMQNGERNSTLTGELNGTLHSHGLFIVRWEGGQILSNQTQQTQSNQSHSNQARSDQGQAIIPLRIRRLLKAVSLRFAKLSDSVLYWTMSGTSLILTVSFASDKQGSSAAPEEVPEIAAGRMAFLLRDTMIRVFTDFRYSRRLENGSSLRYGFGWIDNSSNGENSAGITTSWDEAILAAYEAAWQRMFFAGNPIRLPLSEYPTLTVDFDFKVNYLPIVSLLDGSLYGFEAIPVKAHSGARINLSEFYENADQAGQLFEVDRRFREAAIRGFPSRNGDVKLFLPVPAKIIFDPRLYPGSTLRRIEAANLRPEHVVLMMVGGDGEHGVTMKAALSHYRNQGFRIALSGITPSFDSLRRMMDMHPDYAQMNVGWVSGKGFDPVEESMLQGVISLTRKEQIVLIANGLDQEELLPALVASGMNYVQGKWLDRGVEDRMVLAPDIQTRIRSEVNRRYQGATGTLTELVEPVKTMNRETPVSEVSRHFELHREGQGIVIADNGKPIGLLMKEKLHQLLSGQFGLPLYWNRSVGKIMDTHPMIVEESITVDQASQMAMAREPDKLYDAVIVTRDGLVSGITSIRSMLEWITQSRMADAQWANPLSGLPGNEPIRRELIRRLGEGRPFAVLYADLDHFKWYNDQYGFHKGDDVLRFTGETLLETIRAQTKADCFVGHIGGDDFIVISSGSDLEEMAREVIHRFEKGIGAFTGKHTGPVLDRAGRPLEAAGLSISLSLLLCQSSSGWTPEALSERAALLKKKAKQLNGNALVWESIAENVEFQPVVADLTAH
ncbi:GGDEF domain-containing protein [Cohnella mopanensis]|uniref:GGDEF domain-containing protein n=1 Tax=Cohnella mopanensis TaxID=2911966 RepID=UPI001EF862D7|nr:GGDEF domain-containing protein [Cohnella mopanensis]